MERWKRNIRLSTLRHREQYAELIEALPDKPESLGDLQDAAIAYFHTGDPDRAVEFLAQMIEIANERGDGYSDIAAVLTQMGETDQALEYLEKALQAREVNFAFTRIDPDLRPLHNDPRFLDLLERAGLRMPSPD